MSLFWKDLPPLIKRIITILIVFVFAVIITLIGTLTPIEQQEANDVDKKFNQTINALKKENLILPYIFGNNFMITLIMFAPIIGVIFGGYVLYNTGYAIAAIATSRGYHPISTFLILFLTPVAWLEFAAYSAAMAESVWFTIRIFQGKGKRELANVTKFIAVCAVVLLVAAIAETALIMYSLPSENGASNGSYF